MRNVFVREGFVPRYCFERHPFVDYVTAANVGRLALFYLPYY